ncbi:helix-turn-helix domain-containing protein [Streptomyces daliensis]|uniref:Helix-turn-helix transcriptional regulator n=1 Tax=Streptomyces daliensis TaxID=299421 RepID=A0A8T4IQI2_9ACTN|nr:helix-turn-helix transcriptional regulator [Streptomyces daliensis]
MSQQSSDPCASSAIGRTIVELRRAVGWSQTRLADEFSKVSGQPCTRQDVSRWECGKRTPRLRTLRALAAALQVPVQILEWSAVHRRTFVTDIAATAIAPVVASDLVLNGFEAALTTSAPDIDQWRETLTAYGHDYMSMGAADIRRRLTSDLVLLQRQADRPELWGIAAKLMTLYAKTFPGSDGVKAVSWYRMAARAADRSEDTDTRVWVRGRAAIALGYEGAALRVADQLAAEALALDDRPSLGRLNAVMGRAHVAAIRGDRRTAVALADEGHRIHDRVGSHEQASDYAVPHWRRNVDLSMLLARLGEERGAVEAQEVARRELPPELPRFATHLEMHRGLMMARAGDQAGGARYARAALDKLPPEKHSLSLRMLLDEIQRGAGAT